MLDKLKYPAPVFPPLSPNTISTFATPADVLFSPMVNGSPVESAGINVEFV
jgi:hypothetical protein